MIQGLILAKVVILGDVFGFGRKMQHKPLIYSTVYQTAVFSIWVGVFSIFEKTLVAYLEGKGLFGGLEELRYDGKYALFARCLIIFFTFIPFFAFRDLGRVLGENRLLELFFTRKTAV